MKRLKLFNRIIFILAIVGFLIALYVTQSFLRQTSIVCVNTGCELVRNSPASYLFGIIPVPAVGLLGYAIIALLAFLRSTLYSLPSTFYTRAILAIATFGVAFTLWFTYTELFIIKGICTWCAISTINMFIIFLLSIKSYILEKK